MYNLVCSFGVFFSDTDVMGIGSFCFPFKVSLLSEIPGIYSFFFSKKIWLMAFISFKELARLLLIIMILLQQKLTIHVHVLLLSYTLKWSIIEVLNEVFCIIHSNEMVLFGCTYVWIKPE